MKSKIRVAENKKQKRKKKITEKVVLHCVQNAHDLKAVLFHDSIVIYKMQQPVAFFLVFDIASYELIIETLLSSSVVFLLFFLLPHVISPHSILSTFIVSVVSFSFNLKVFYVLFCSFYSLYPISIVSNFLYFHYI